jgi:hypothetical protein
MFNRQIYNANVDGTLKGPAWVDLQGFMVGTIEGSGYDIGQLQVDLNAARFGWSTDLDVHSWKWDFVFIRNIRLDKPTVDIYAFPRTNTRSADGARFGFYQIEHDELQNCAKFWLKAQWVIATYIEGWLAGKEAKRP